MRRILEDLWYGNLAPTQMSPTVHNECLKFSKLLEQYEQKLISTLNSSEKALFENCKKYCDEITLLSENDIFNRGFTLGARMVMACFDTDDRNQG